MEQRNLVLAIVLSVAVLLGFQLLFPTPKPNPAALLAASSQAASGPAGGVAPSAGATAVKIAAPRLQIRSGRLLGSIDLAGARFDDLSLTDYHATTNPHSSAIRLLADASSEHPYFAEQGWIARDPGTRVPDGQSVWHAPAGAVLTPSTPVTLTWDNGNGLIFEQNVSLDANFMFTIRQTVTNHGHAPVSLQPYSLVSRGGPIAPSATYISYEGPIGGFDTGAREVKYKDIAADNPVEQDSAGGWVGFTDKYWLTSVAPLDQTAHITARFTRAADIEKYQADWLGGVISVAPGATGGSAGYFFAGAKEVRLIDHYKDALNLPHFDTAVDWGWFYFLTKPIFYLLDMIAAKVGNFGIAILILTVLFKMLFFPLANRAYENMHKMKKVQPEIVKLREKYGEDKVKLNQELMALNKKAGVNPLLGCLPILVQIPVFFSLYKVLYVTIEMRHAPFYGWIHDLSAPDPTSLFNLFGLIPWTPPHMFAIGAWPLIYCATMFLQQRMQPPMPDPVQQRMMMFMPIMFTFMMGGFPAGLVIYWSWNNTLTVAQQWFITRRLVSAEKRQALA